MGIPEVEQQVRVSLRQRGIRIATPIKQTHSLTCYYHGAEGYIGVPFWQVVKSPEALHRTLLHECGHAFMYENFCWESAAFERLFGRLTTPYPGYPGLLWAAITPRTMKHVSAYAKAHPEEDFAETFVHVVQRGSLSGFSLEVQRKIEFVRDAVKRHSKSVK